MSTHAPGKVILPEIRRVPFAIGGEGRRLNIGAGMDPTSGMLRVDIAGSPDVFADIRELPFQDGAFVEVRAFHILEHLPRECLVPCMNEFWRILSVGGAVDIEVPLAPSDVAFADPTHLSFFVSGTWDYFLLKGPQEEHRLLYGIHPWKQLRKERMGNNEIIGLTLEKVS